MSGEKVTVAGILLPDSGISSWDREEISVTHEAYDGQIGVGRLTVLDAASGESPDGGKAVQVVFDYGGGSEAVAFLGFLGEQQRTRGYDSALLRRSTYSLQDANAILAHRNINDWKRPRESDRARIRAAMRKWGPNDLNISLYVPDTNAVTMPAKRYQDTNLDEVFQDAMALSGKTWFVSVSDTGVYRLHWHRLNEDVGFTASITVTDSGADHATSFAPVDPQRTKDPYDLANKIRVYNDKRAKIVKDADSIDAHDGSGLKHQDQLSYLDDNSNTTLASYGGAELRERKDERFTYSFSLSHLPNPRVVQAGQLLTITSAVLELSASPKRVARITWESPAPGVWNAALECEHPKRLARRPRRKRPDKKIRPKDIHRVEADTGPYTLDSLDRTVAAPSHVDGGATGMSLGRDAGIGGVDTDGVEQAFSFGFSPISGVGSWVGWWYLGWADAGNPCSGYYNGFLGWMERESWFSGTVPTYPADMAGIMVTAAGGILSSGGGVALARGLRVVVMASQPTGLRQGSIVGTFYPDGAGHDIFIPAAAIPPAGSTIYIGIQAGWECDYGTYVCDVKWPYMTGRNNSGHAGTSSISGTNWRTWADEDTGIGTTQTQDDDAPFEGGKTWHDAGTEGTPTVEMGGGCLTITSTAPAGRGWTLIGPREDDDESWFPASDPGFALEVHFKASVLGDEGEAGLRHLEITQIGQQVRPVARFHLGDMVHPPGLSVYGPGTEKYAAKASFAADTMWKMLIDTRTSDEIRAKAWPATGRMPTKWDVRVPITETADDGDRLMIWGRVGDGTGAQTLYLCQYLIYAMADEGELVVKEFVGIAEGDTNRFYTSHRFQPGTLRAFINGHGQAPAAQHGSSAYFLTDHKPPAGAWIRATYVAAG